MSLDTIFHVDPKLRLTITIANLSETQLYTGRPSKADGIRTPEETAYIAEWHKRLDVYIEQAIKDMPR